MVFGGVCKYKVKSDAGLLDKSVASNDAIGIPSVFGSNVELVQSWGTQDLLMNDIFFKRQSSTKICSKFDNKFFHQY